MRIPWDVRWDREVVYECIWSLLCAVDGHNRQIRHRGGVEKPIKSVLMTPLATGCGMVSYERWAEQTVLAMKYFVEAVEKPEVWSRMTWENVFQKQVELNATWEEDCDCE
ncbi:hypothetical protein HII31_02861 [Pseudocercospora fuligena]|uniref:Uncharacterized protein n=1 Tax=Pseudocercospora fuligena TaxID=685502 RepID=A0A8H6RRF5_9PEZI|nr:hypothetical protein HII31_02861 [Pseudocercospora fuligena]